MRWRARPDLCGGTGAIRFPTAIAESGGPEGQEPLRPGPRLRSRATLSLRRGPGRSRALHFRVEVGISVTAQVAPCRVCWGGLGPSRKSRILASCGLHASRRIMPGPSSMQPTRLVGNALAHLIRMLHGNGRTGRKRFHLVCKVAQVTSLPGDRTGQPCRAALDLVEVFPRNGQIAISSLETSENPVSTPRPSDFRISM